MHSICVFCGSRSGHDPAFAEAARRLGHYLGTSGHHLVFGGGRVGLMGALADATLQAGGEVTGVIPRHLLDREVGHPDVTRLEVVEDMLTRKQRMIELSDAAITLPGGLGSLDELLEVMTWRQLGQLSAPLALLNQQDYYRPLLTQFEHAVEAGFMEPGHLRLLQVVTDMDELEDWLDRPRNPGAAEAAP